jgi:peptidoglycan/xylan/chitin deacetylase (PgdA/CDA1 family)
VTVQAHGSTRRWWLLGIAVVTAAVVVVAVLVARGSGEHGRPQARSSTAASPTSSALPAAPSTSATPTSPAGTPTVPAALRGEDVTVIPAGTRSVALTFDAGANSAGLPSILATLADEHVHATFFLTGQWAADHPAGVAAIHAGGHRVGNHSMTHPAFTGLSDAAIRGEVLDAEHAISAAGADPRPLFRFPFGDRDSRTIAAVNDLGYVAVRWTVDTLGWKGTSGGITAQQVADRAVGALQPGEIVLMHIGSNPDDGTTLDADALPETIRRMRAAGYDFGTLDALLTSP